MQIVFDIRQYNDKYKKTYSLMSIIYFSQCINYKKVFKFKSLTRAHPRLFWTSEIQTTAILRSSCIYLMIVKMYRHLLNQKLISTLLRTCRQSTEIKRLRYNSPIGRRLSKSFQPARSYRGIKKHTESNWSKPRQIEQEKKKREDDK